MVDSNGTSIVESGFVIEAAGLNTTCNANGTCGFSPAQNNTDVVIRYHNLVVFTGSVFHTDLTINITQKIAVVDIANCQQANLTFNNITSTVTCGQSQYFMAPTAAGQIVVESANQSKTVAYTVANFSGFRTAFFVMMYYPVSV